MRTFDLNADFADLSDAKDQLAEGQRALVVRVVQRLRFWQQTWFLDENEGVPYLRDERRSAARERLFGADSQSISILNAQARSYIPQALITSELENLDEVAAVSDVRFSFDPTTRRFRYQCVVVGADGSTANIDANAP